MIMLLKNLPYFSAAGGTGGSYTSPWVGYPEQLGDCEIWVVCETHNTGSVNVQLESSVDGVQPDDVGGVVNAAAAGVDRDQRNVTGTMVRVSLSTTAAAILTLSVYLVPKQSRGI